MLPKLKVNEVIKKYQFLTEEFYIVEQSLGVNMFQNIENTSNEKIEENKKVGEFRFYASNGDSQSIELKQIGLRYKSQ